MPKPPTNLSLSKGTNNTINLKWDDVDLRDMNVSEHLIEMKEGDGDYVMVGRVAGDQNNFEYLHGPYDEECSFRIRSKNKIGLSQPFVTETVSPEKQIKSK